MQTLKTTENMKKSVICLGKTIVPYIILSSFLLGACEQEESIQEPFQENLAPTAIAHSLQPKSGEGQAFMPPEEFPCIRRGVEFDIYDINPEFVNPKDYELTILYKNRKVYQRSFNQHCTMNNTALIENIAEGSYKYLLSTSCSNRDISGKFTYSGGYQTYTIHIDQSLCD